jgi:hypothetical protein
MLSFGVVALEFYLPPVCAPQASDPLETCYQMSDDSAQLACFRREMQRRHALAAGGTTYASSASTSGAASAPAALGHLAAAPTRSADDTVGLDGKQLAIKRKAEGIPPSVVKPIVAALLHLRSRPGHQYSFELDNGQVWEATDTEPDLFLKPHETVTIKPGVLGAFLLKTEEGISVRVHRVR